MVCKDIACLSSSQVEAWVAIWQQCTLVKSTTPTKTWLKKAHLLIEPIQELFTETMARWLQWMVKHAEQINMPFWTVDKSDEAWVIGFIWMAGLADAEVISPALAEFVFYCHQYARVDAKSDKLRSVRAASAGFRVLTKLGESGLRAINYLATIGVHDCSIAATRGTPPTLLQDYEQYARFESGVTNYPFDDNGCWNTSFGSKITFKYDLNIGYAMMVDGQGHLLEKEPRYIWQHLSCLRHNWMELDTAIDFTRNCIRNFLEQSLVQQHIWPAVYWLERYNGQTLLLNQLGHKLIWQITQHEQVWDVFWLERAWRTRDGVALPKLDETATVRLWHPVLSSAKEIAAWQDFLSVNQITQPFPQAGRAYFDPLPLELECGVSERFSGFPAPGLTHIYPKILGRSREKLTYFCWHVTNFWHVMNWSDLSKNTPVEGADIHAILEAGTLHFFDHDAPLAINDVPIVLFSEAIRSLEEQITPFVIKQRSKDVELLMVQAPMLINHQKILASRKKVLALNLSQSVIADCYELEEWSLVIRGHLNRYRLHLVTGEISLESDGRIISLKYNGIAPVDTIRGSVRKRIRREKLLAFLNFLPSDFSHWNYLFFNRFDSGDVMTYIIFAQALYLAADNVIDDVTVLAQIQ